MGKARPTYIVADMEPALEWVKRRADWQLRSPPVCTGTTNGAQCLPEAKGQDTGRVVFTVAYYGSAIRETGIEYLS